MADELDPDFREYAVTPDGSAVETSHTNADTMTRRSTFPLASTTSAPRRPPRTDTSRSAMEPPKLGSSLDPDKIEGYEHQYVASLPYTDYKDANGVTWRVDNVTKEATVHKTAGDMAKSAKDKTLKTAKSVTSLIASAFKGK